MAKENQYQASLSFRGKTYTYFDINAIANKTGRKLQRLPYSTRILLECCLRNAKNNGFSPDHTAALLDWDPKKDSFRDAVPFLPARVLLQDFTGLPVLNDLTALRAAVKRDGKDSRLVNPRIPTNLVIDHSLQVNTYGCEEARRLNETHEFKQNYERYQFLKWSQAAYDNLRILPPGLGICHQVNLEHLGQVAFISEEPNGEFYIYPDSVLGTDSHTTMINGLGVAGWGVGGIEAVAALLKYPSEFPIPDVIGVHLTGTLSDASTPTDLTLQLTARLRQFGVVGKFVEVIGESASHLPVETRAMIANMSPESGATMTYFPVDEQTIDFMVRTGRPKAHADLAREYFRTQGLFRENDDKQIEYSQVIELDLGAVEPVLSGPKRPHDTFAFSSAKSIFEKSLAVEKGLHGYGLSKAQVSVSTEVEINDEKHTLTHGSVLIAAITSCTNTSDPSVMIGAALLAKNAAEKGLRSKPWVKTSFAPGSRVVSAYLEKAGLMHGLNTLGFNLVGYGCTTCIGNSGPLNPAIEKAVADNELITAGILSGNRNFEGRIHHATQANFLASPPLVVAYALAGRINFDFENEALGNDKDGSPIFLKDIYPSSAEVARIAGEFINSDLYEKNYRDIYDRNKQWNAMPVPEGTVYQWEQTSTILQEPSFLFDGFLPDGALGDIEDACALAVFGDSITTDHISPAGSIASENPAAHYLNEHGIKTKDYISFGARRGNHEVMARGTFSNPRLRNKLVSGIVGGYTIHLPDGDLTTIYDAARRYKKSGTPLIILAGKAYGTGSSRDWAAKGTYMLGVQAVIAESFERIHRTNLVCMGILPLQFKNGENADTLGLTGKERFTIKGITDINSANAKVIVNVLTEDGRVKSFTATVRIDTPLDLDYFKAGGLMRKLRADF